jgi:hypothetical protein
MNKEHITPKQTHQQRLETTENKIADLEKAVMQVQAYLVMIHGAMISRIKETDDTKTKTEQENESVQSNNK